MHVDNDPLYQFESARRHWEDTDDLYSKRESRKVFVNIPYATAYYHLEVALCSTLIAYDLIPILAKHSYHERMILKKLLHLIDICGYGVSDLSDANRMNLPFEHGLILGKKPIKRACALVASYPPIRDHLSDLQGLVLKEHGNCPARLVQELAEWLWVNAKRDIPEIRLSIRPTSIVRTLPAVEKLLAQNRSYATVAAHYDELLLEACLSEGNGSFGQGEAQ